jgi:hypothetical protein
MTVIKTKTAEFSLPEENLILCRMLEDADVDVPAVDENFEATMKIANEQRYAVLVDGRATVQISKEAMERAARPEHHRLLIAQAIVVNSLANRLIGNFIIKFHKPGAPTRLFSNTEQAWSWLKERLVEDKKNSVVKTGGTPVLL